MEKCKAIEKEVFVGSCDNTISELPGTCGFNSSIGYIIMNNNDEAFKLACSMGIDIGKEVEAFARNYQPCNGSQCLYSWENAPTEVWQKLSTEPRVLQIRGNAKIDLYQVVGECAFVQVRSNRYIIHRTKAGNKTTEIWDAGDQVKIAGRTLGGKGFQGESLPCPWHAKHEANFVFDKEVPDTAIKVIATHPVASFAYVPWLTCPSGHFIVGISSSKGEDFICKEPVSGKKTTLNGGKFGAEVVCESGGVVVGFQLKDQDGGYNLLCSYGKPVSNTNYEVAAADMDEAQYCGREMALCGLTHSPDKQAWRAKCCPVGK